VILPLGITHLLCLKAPEGNTVGVRTLADDIADSTQIFRIDRDVVTVSYTWPQTNYGCIRLGIASLCENTCAQLGARDGNFNIPNTLVDSLTVPWSLNASFQSPPVSVLDGKMIYASAAVNSWTKIEDVDVIPCSSDNLTYDFILDIEAVSKCSVQIELGGDTATYTTTGTKTFQLTPVNDQPLKINFIDAAGFQGSATLNNILMQLSINPSGAKWQPNFLSNVFDFKESHADSLIVAAANNEDAYGLRFESAFFTPKARVKGSLRAFKYDPDVESHVNGLNKKIIDYFEQRKSMQLRLQGIPEYLADWLSLFRGFNIVYVDDVEYVCESDVEITWNRFCDTAKIGIEIGEIRQDLTNTNKKGLTAITDINSFLVREFDEKEEIILITGESIKLKG